MGAGLIVRNENNELLFNTENISYGLVKSGYLTYVENWRQLRRRGVNLDPNIGSSWVDQGIPGIDQYGFTLSDARSPIVFLVGKGIQTGVSKSGSNTTFMFASSSSETKYYCFDLMVDDNISGVGLKTRDVNGNITFNSRQPALNVISSIQAPTVGVPVINSGGKPATTYIGGYTQRIRFETASGCANIHSVVDINLDSGTEYAAFLPWNRSCGCVDTNSTGFNTRDIYGVAEGAYGRSGGISFYFGATGRSTQDQWYGQETVINYYLLPENPRPTALIIKTNNLPFPFN